ncbi:DUF2141 domain-containing protein [Alteromonas gracilis]|uniref:DUF2141 domain-containing protein n=1 Tax=Alteromonas gracilis TaxID=1479524 RepID=UPI0030CE9B29
MKLAKSLTLIAAACGSLFTTNVVANEYVTLAVNLEGIKTGHAPLYISVQDANQFRTDEGAGGTILRSQENENMTVELNVEPGIYAVSIWHDLDEDGKFSRGKDYWPTDGWGSSNNPQTGKAPSFDDMKIEVTHDGQVIPITMQYAKR